MSKFYDLGHRYKTETDGKGNNKQLCPRLVMDQREPPRGKTNNVVSEQVRHKQACTGTEDS